MMPKRFHSKPHPVPDRVHCLALAARISLHSSGSAHRPRLLLSRCGMHCKCTTIETVTNHLSESPRWYIKKHRYSDAFHSLVRLRNTDVQAARDLYYIQAQVRLEEEALGGGDIITSDGQERPSGSGGYFSRFIQLFMYPRIRRATLAAFVVMIAQQMCGSMSPRPHQPWRKSASAAKSPS